MDEFEQQVLEQPVEEQNVVELEPDLQLEGDAVDAWNYTCWAKCRDEAWGLSHPRSGSPLMPIGFLVPLR